MPKLEYYPNKVLVIGNGFDLNQGLKTSYSDFINSSNFNNLLERNNNLASYLKNKHELVNWIDVENELKTYSASNAYNMKEKELKDDFESIKKALILYLKDTENSNLKKETDSYNLIKEVVKHSFVIIDFNYTNTIRFMLMDLGVEDSVINQSLVKIHGSIDENEVIFGVEDDARLKREHVFLKKAYNKNFKGLTINPQLEKSTELHFFGHSLGETDHTYFKFFFNRYSLTQNLDHGKNIYLHHYGEEGYHELHIQLNQLTNNNLSGLKQVNKFIPLDVKK